MTWFSRPPRNGPVRIPAHPLQVASGGSGPRRVLVDGCPRHQRDRFARLREVLVQCATKGERRRRFSKDAVVDGRIVAVPEAVRDVTDVCRGRLAGQEVQGHGGSDALDALDESAIRYRLAVDGVAGKNEAAGGDGTRGRLRGRLCGNGSRKGRSNEALLRSPDTQHREQDDEQQGEQQMRHERLGHRQVRDHSSKPCRGYLPMVTFLSLFRMP